MLGAKHGAFVVPVLTNEFFRHERGNHDETWYRLARGTDTGDVFIEQEWAARGNVGSKRMEVADSPRKGATARGRIS